MFLILLTVEMHVLYVIVSMSHEVLLQNLELHITAVFFLGFLYLELTVLNVQEIILIIH